jgi:UV DNA damage endonuclease
MPPVVHLAEEVMPETLRLGLCCQFLDRPIKFRSATHRYAGSLTTDGRRRYLSDLAAANAASLAAAIGECHALGIGAFRVASQLLPLMTHPASGYRVADLDDPDGIERALRAARHLASEYDIRLSFHPDQFVVLNSDRPDVVASSIRELEAQAEIAELIGADTVTIHAGGGVGGKDAALDRLRSGIDRLSDRARSLLAVENDDRLYTIADLLPISAATGVPLVYDVHHHRCNPDKLPVAEATVRAIDTWHGREPYFHVSAPRDGAHARDLRPHADYVELRHVPLEWRGRSLTVDVEAKAKERAVLRLRDALAYGAVAPNARTG